MERVWEQLEYNEIHYLENNNHYISINKDIRETALRLKGDIDYDTFIVKGIHKEVFNSLDSDYAVLKWFSKNNNGFWSNDIKILNEYITNNFMK